MSKRVFHHERVITLTLLSSIGVGLCALGYKLIDFGLQKTPEKILFGVLVVLIFLIVLQMVCRLLMSITVDRKRQTVTFRYVLAPRSFFDIFPKRRVVVPFSEIVTVRQGAVIRYSHVYSWHVHTVDSRVTYSAYIKKEKQLRARLHRISMYYGGTAKEARYEHSQAKLEKASLIGAACVLIGSILYFVFIVYF